MASSAPRVWPACRSPVGATAARLTKPLKRVGPGVLAFESGWPALLCALAAALSASGGILVERWLFFAEAKHSVTLYYGARTV